LAGGPPVVSSLRRSPQSKEGSERVEAKLDELLHRVDPDEGEKLIAELDRKFHRTA
jgi:hypothetical protein